MLEWFGYETNDFNADFIEANPEVTLEWEYGASDADILSLMQAGSQADVFHFYTGWQQFYVDEGLVQEIDTSKLTNWDAVPADMQALGQVDGKRSPVPVLVQLEHVPDLPDPRPHAPLVPRSVLR